MLFDRLQSRIESVLLAAEIHQALVNVLGRRLEVDEVTLLRRPVAVVGHLAVVGNVFRRWIEKVSEGVVLWRLHVVVVVVVGDGGVVALVVAALRSLLMVVVVVANAVTGVVLRCLVVVHVDGVAVLFWNLFR